ncbi:glycosyltransferase family 4 protein [Haladaptatus sp. CMAA 1911]|uniref:glycosyltransferase family 4 protein n=1 Tax=unclassified Haladaptatus TaxID=2622732 RepID=UPI003754D183
MHVVQTPCRFHPDIGGVESYVRDISKEMVRKGHDVTVVCTRNSPRLPRSTTIDGIRIERVDPVGKIANTSVTPRLPLKLLKIARRADVIHTHIPTPWSADISALVGLVTNTPVVLTYHNDITGEGVNHYVAQLYNKTALQFLLRVTDRIIVTQEGYLSHSPHIENYAEKVTVVNNGVDTREFRPKTVPQKQKRQIGLDPARPNLFFLGVLDEYHEYKGLNTLLRAVKEIALRDGDTPKLLVGGDGSRRLAYESTVTKMGIDNHVEFCGRVSQVELQQLYSSADLFVLPSNDADQEGFGLVILESLASGTPVVTTNVVGVSDHVADLNIGIIVEKDKHEALADAIVDAVNTIDDFEMDEARKLCEREYSWKASTEMLLDIYESL